MRVRHRGESAATASHLGKGWWNYGPTSPMSTRRLFSRCWILWNCGTGEGFMSTVYRKKVRKVSILSPAETKSSHVLALPTIRILAANGAIWWSQMLHQMCCHLVMVNTPSNVWMWRAVMLCMKRYKKMPCFWLHGHWSERFNPSGSLVLIPPTRVLCDHQRSHVMSAQDYRSFTKRLNKINSWSHYFTQHF